MAGHWLCGMAGRLQSSQQETRRPDVFFWVTSEGTGTSSVPGGDILRAALVPDAAALVITSTPAVNTGKNDPTNWG